MDEFYGGYNYTSDCDGTVVSAADNIEDVDEDGMFQQACDSQLFFLTGSRYLDHRRSDKALPSSWLESCLDCWTQGVY